MFVDPPTEIIRGFAFESSGFDPSSFYMWAFVHPLYVPEPRLSITFGHRIGGGSRSWRPESHDTERVMAALLAHMEHEGLPFLERLRTPRAVAETGYQVVGSDDNIRVIEAVAYSWIIAGDYPRAIRELDRLQRVCRGLPQDIAWIREVAEQGRRVRNLLSDSPKEAVQLLENWMQVSKRQIGLTNERMKQA